LLLARRAGGCYQFVRERHGVRRSARTVQKFIFLPVVIPATGKSVSQKNDVTNLVRCEIFRGKVPPRKTQNQNNHLEIRTHLRQTYEQSESIRPQGIAA
jgi:hypothetical protein